MRRRLSAAIVGTLVLLTAFAPTTLAECMNWPLVANERPRVAFAFIATVTNVERRDLFEAGRVSFAIGSRSRPSASTAGAFRTKSS